MIILNLTQHQATPDQVAEGVIELDSNSKEQVKNLLTFTEAPTVTEMRERARQIAVIVVSTKPEGCLTAMIGGAPYFMGILEGALRYVGITPVYAFSKRIVEEVEENGVVKKVSTFKHAGWVAV